MVKLKQLVTDWFDYPNFAESLPPQTLDKLAVFAKNSYNFTLSQILDEKLTDKSQFTLFTLYYNLLLDISLPGMEKLRDVPPYWISVVEEKNRTMQQSILQERFKNRFEVTGYGVFEGQDTFKFRRRCQYHKIQIRDNSNNHSLTIHVPEDI